MPVVDIHELVSLAEQSPATTSLLAIVVLFLLGILGFFIRRWFFKDKNKVGRSVVVKENTVGGDFIVGDGNTINRNQVIEERNLSKFQEMVKNKTWSKNFIKYVETWICDFDNAYQIEVGEKERDFTEKWTQVYPDKNGSYSKLVHLKINGVIIKEMCFVVCDGGRIFVPMPSVELAGEKGLDRIFIWDKNSLAYEIGEKIGEFDGYHTIKGVADMSKILIK